jgi:ABC transport system ATP-binding/permease protein
MGAGALLEQFGFAPEAQRAFVDELSGGERRRLELLLVLAEAPNVLLLDEPTNDLDLDTLEVLEEYLDDWPGVLVVASHDRYFLDRVCNDLFSIEPNGSVQHHPGGWSAWREQRAEQVRRSKPAAAPAPRGDDRSAARARKLSYAERRELTSLERRLPQLEARKEELTAELQAAADDYAVAQRAGDELAGVLAEIEAAEVRWLELSEIGETA